jgi:HlyD family secretion protein
MMKITGIIKSITAMFIIGGLLMTTSGCGAKAEPAANSKLTAIKRGNLSFDIIGAGNLALSQSKELPFEIAGYVEAVLVQEGETVKAGQALARIDTSDWEKKVQALNKAVITAKRNLTAKESSLTQVSRQVTDKEYALRQAELDLQTAQKGMDNIAEVKEIQDRIDNNQDYLDLAQSMYKAGVSSTSGGIDTAYWKQEIANTQRNIDAENKEMQDLLKGKSIKLTASDLENVVWQVNSYRLNLEKAQKRVEDARIAVKDAQTAVSNAELDTEDAEQNVKEAQSDLNEASGLSPIVKAPFDGFITKVNVQGGAEVFKGSIAMTIADPTRFKADIVVGENDIVQVKEGGAASIQIDAIQGLTLPASVKHISPTGTIQQGVVNYKVTVELASLSIAPAGGQGPTSTPGTTGRSGPANILSPQVAAVSQIKDGMSVTVSIIVSQRTNVILVPNQAITYGGRASQVQVSKDGVMETRTIRTGMNDWQYTEVLEGLAEGDEVVILTSVIPASTKPGQTPQRQQQIPIPNSGGGIRTR